MSMLIIEKPLESEKDTGQKQKLEEIYLFKALCKKILGQTDLVSNGQSSIADGVISELSNITKVIPPDWREFSSRRRVSTLNTQSIKPQCEFVVSLKCQKSNNCVRIIYGRGKKYQFFTFVQLQKFHHYQQTKNLRPSSSDTWANTKRRHNHGHDLQITETHKGKSATTNAKNISSEIMVSSVEGVIGTDDNEESFILIHPSPKDKSYESTFIFSKATSLHSRRLYNVHFWIMSILIIYIHSSLVFMRNNSHV